MIIKVEVDQEECSQCGICYNDECPEVFEEDEDGTCQVKEEYRTEGPGEGAIPPELKGCAKDAADACPMDAIVVFETD